MAMAARKQNLKCTTCKQNITSKEYLKCTLCGKVFDVHCTRDISEKRFRIMTPLRRQTIIKSWKCHVCNAKYENQVEKIKDTKKTTILQKQNMGSSKQSTPLSSPAAFQSPISSPPTANVAGRKIYEVNVPTENSFESLQSDSDDEISEADEESTMLQKSALNRSCPNLAATESDAMKEMKIKLDDLTAKLQTTNRMYDGLLLENDSLLRRITEYEHKIHKLTIVCKQVSKKPKKKGRKSINTNDLYINESNPDVQSLNLSELESEVEEIDQTVDNTSGETITPINHQNNVCIISSNKRNKVITTARSSLQNSKHCHFLVPNVGLRQLLVNLENKVQNYTLYDSCIIMIGENDFETSMDYKNLVNILRTELLKIQHTNVFICLPTFRQGLYKSLLFNQRVETFNNLLYLDNLKYEYAYVIDSNRNLTYDNDMFTTYKGTLNNRGLRQIFSDLNGLMNDVLLPYLDDPTTKSITGNNSQGTDFFRFLY